MLSFYQSLWNSKNVKIISLKSVGKPLLGYFFYILCLTMCTFVDEVFYSRIDCTIS